jgi:hypothetical protein
MSCAVPTVNRLFVYWRWRLEELELEGVRVSTLTIVEVDSEDQVTAPSNAFYRGPTE